MAEFVNGAVRDQDGEVMVECNMSYYRLLHDYLHSNRPDEKMTDGNLEKAAVETTMPLNVRFKYGEKIGCNWVFEVSSKSKCNYYNFICYVYTCVFLYRYLKIFFVHIIDGFFFFAPIQYIPVLF